MMATHQVCAKSVSNFAEVYNADYKGTFAHVDLDADIHLGLVRTCRCGILQKFTDLDAEFHIDMQNSALVCIILH